MTIMHDCFIFDERHSDGITSILVTLCNWLFTSCCSYDCHRGPYAEKGVVQDTYIGLCTQHYIIL